MSSKKTDTRTRILQTTLQLLESGQSETVRMADIARKAGISRQALYLHFATRAELLIATTFYLDELKDSEARLAASRSAASGVERLEAFIDAWGSYIPEVYGMAKALMAMAPTDDAAAEAWSQRMADMREGCEAAIKALKADGALAPEFSEREATDFLWTLLSVRNWEQLTQQCGWSQQTYLKTVKASARQLFVT